jgi:hypothetical protein
MDNASGRDILKSEGFLVDEILDLVNPLVETNPSSQSFCGWTRELVSLASSGADVYGSTEARREAVCRALLLDQSYEDNYGNDATSHRLEKAPMVCLLGFY